LKLYVYVIRRLILLIPVILGVTVITFILSHADIGLLIAGYEGKTRSLAARLIVIHELHLNGPVYVQFFYYFTNLFTGKWGYLSPTEPVDAGTPVFTEFLRRFPPTAELSIIATIIVIALGLPLGVLSGVKKDRAVDHATRLAAMVGVSIPTFWIGLLILILIGPKGPFPHFLQVVTEGQIDFLKYGFTSSGALQPWVAVSGASGISRPTGFMLVDTLLYGDVPAFLDALEHVIWPALVVALTSFGVVTRFMRSSMLETLGLDYIRTARSKGLPEKIVIKKHARRNAYGATTTVMGLFFAGLLSGVTVTEYVFGWPGMGQWLYTAAARADLVSVMATTFVFTIVIVIANLIVDLIYSYLDPRVRLD
jgi:peptide/nickel transport system permease protein